MKPLRWIAPFLLSLVFSAGLFLLWPNTATAQDPGPGPCMSNTSAITATYNFALSSYSTEFEPTPTDLHNTIRGSTLTNTVLAQYTSNGSYLGGANAWYDVLASTGGQNIVTSLASKFSIQSPITGTSSTTITLTTFGAGANQKDFTAYCINDNTFIQYLYLADGVDNFVLGYNQTCDRLMVASGPTAAGSISMAVVQVSISCGAGTYPPPSGIEACSLVENANFSDDEGWLLVGSAVITNGALSLPVGGIAAQNLTLQSTTAYSAVISTTTPFSGEASIDLTLGTQSQTIEITTTGRYTASFTTPSLGGPIAYGLENNGPDPIDLDFTCVFLASSGGSEDGSCLAPTNGTFESADNWTYYRGATWQSPAKKALLPYADAGLVETTPPFTFSSIIPGQYLLMSFTAQKDGNDPAYVGTRGLGGPGAIIVTSTYQVYPTEYLYEIDFTDLASATNGSISFVNPGSPGLDGLTSQADFKVDNVCVFLANRPPNLPTPLDPDAITPIDLGVNYTSCDDVDGLLAGFGVNIQQYRAEYEAGASVWDPIGWVPWLVAAFWTILAMYLCVFMAAFVTLVDILEYLINNFLNIGSWLIRSWPIFTNFLYSLWIWFLATLPQLLVWLGQAFVLVLTWFFLSGGNLVVFTVFMLGYFIQALLDYLNWSVFDLPGYLLALLLNGLRGIVNLLIAAWNLFIPAFEAVLSGLADLWVSLWNLVAPFLSAVWSYILSGSTPLLLISPMIFLLTAIFNLIWMVILWIWANIFMVVNIPIQFYYAFDEGVKSEAFAYLLSCADQNFWCSLLAGIQLLNQVSAHTIVYPVVIVGIIVGSIMIFWREIWALFHIEIS